MTIFSDAKVWSDRWVEVDDASRIISGGQASAKVVRRRDNDDGTLYFLKILSRQTDLKRRERMYVEVACYRVLDHPHIPKLIESNCSSYTDNAYKLYLVTDFVRGACLENVPTPASTDDAIAASLQLCSILSYCHANEVFHRDIKPSNIILRDYLFSDLVLVDFGMSYHGEVSTAITPEGEEVGNRFLRLQELASESNLKRDPRSDVTFCGGMLFFLLTGIRPAQLIDHDNRMPHQRTDVVRQLSDHTSLDIDQILALFDRAFDFRIDRRFQDAGELAAAIRGCVRRDIAVKVENTQAMMERIKRRVSSPADVAIRAQMEVLAQVIRAIQRSTEHICATLGGAFGRYLTGYATEPDQLQIRYTIGIELTTDRRVAFKPTYRARIAGNELVVMVEQDAIYRCDAERVSWHGLNEAVVAYLLPQIDAITGTANDRPQ
jgi:eukaryotic-like serine/threonine-protein kinase